MKLYGLYSKKRNCLMAFYASSNEGDFCNDVEYKLSAYTGIFDYLWSTVNKETADIIANTGSTVWYNADYNTPNYNEEYFGKLSVVCLNDYEVK